MIFRHPQTQCPYCGQKLDASTAFESPNEAPRQGDMVLCVECIKPLVFAEDLRLRKATPAEIADAGAELLRTAESLRAYHRARRTARHLGN